MRAWSTARWLVAVVVAAVLVSSCVSSSHDAVTLSTVAPTTTTIVFHPDTSTSIVIDSALDAYDNLANPVCIRYQRLFRGLHEPTDVETPGATLTPEQTTEIVNFAAGLGNLLDSEVKTLRAITPPPAHAVAIKAALQGLSDAASGLHTVATDLRSGRVDDGMSALMTVSASINQKTFSALGMDFCFPG